MRRISIALSHVSRDEACSTAAITAVPKDYSILYTAVNPPNETEGMKEGDRFFRGFISHLHLDIFEVLCSSIRDPLLCKMFLFRHLFDDVLNGPEISYRR